MQPLQAITRAQAAAGAGIAEIVTEDGKGQAVPATRSRYPVLLRVAADASRLVGGRFGNGEPLEAVSVFPLDGRNGYAGFGHIGLSDYVARHIESGVEQLRTRPFEKWDRGDQMHFLEANAVVLHEAGHLAHPHPSETEEYHKEWAEETLTELVSDADLPRFFKSEYDVDLSAELLSQMRARRQMFAQDEYGAAVPRLDNLLARVGFERSDDRIAAARTLAESAERGTRLHTLAAWRRTALSRQAQ